MHTRSVSLTKVSLPLVAVALLALPSLVWSQQSLRAGAKGATAEAPVTSSPIDADHQALDVYVRGGAGGGGGGVSVSEDAAHVPSEAIVPLGCRRKDVAASSAGTDGDWATVDCDSVGRVRTKPDFLTPNGDALVDDVNDAIRITSTTVTAVGGNVQHDSADAQPPVIIGGHATASIVGETLVTDADAVRWHFGRDGIPVVRVGCPLEDIVSAVVTATSGANTSGIAAQGAGVKTYLFQVIVYNNGASNGSMIITDGSGGATKLKIPFPASTGTTVTLPLPIGFSANTSVFVDPTGSDNIDVTLVGCKSKL